MPVLTLTTSAKELDPERRDALLRKLSQTLARELQKPESYVMVLLGAPTQMLFAGTPAPSCFAELKNIGELSPSDTGRLSQVLCATLSEGLGVPPKRIYIEFSTPPPHYFGFDGGTFA